MTKLQRFFAYYFAFQFAIVAVGEILFLIHDQNENSPGFAQEEIILFVLWMLGQALFLFIGSTELVTTIVAKHKEKDTKEA